MERRTIDLGSVSLDSLIDGDPDRPLVVLLHGFPEVAESWRGLMEGLAGLGYHVVAPNQRGYAGSSKPKGVEAYDLDLLADDVVRLVAVLGRTDYRLIGHDWGAAVGWWLASTRPEGLVSVRVLSAPHPVVWREAMASDPDQRRKSRYVKFFGLPLLPEGLIQLGGYRTLEAALEEARATDEERSACRSAWRQPGALTAMLNWYRALLVRRFEPASAYAVSVPVTLVCGATDPFLSLSAAARCGELWPAARVVSLPGVGHWVNHLPVDRLLSVLGEALPSR